MYVRDGVAANNRVNTDNLKNRFDSVWLENVFANIKYMTVLNVSGSLKYFAAVILKFGVEYPNVAWDYYRASPLLFAVTDTAPPSSDRKTRNNVFRFNFN